MLFHLAACCLTLGIAALQAPGTFVPARMLDGSLPPAVPPNVVGRIEEALEVEVDAAGRAVKLTPLRASPLPADPLVPTVIRWRFQPAFDAGTAVPSHVLVAAIFRPPQLDNSPTLGNPPVDLAAPSDGTPFPLATETPVYPVLGIGEGVVLVEVLIGVDGRVLRSGIAIGAGAFNQAALDAANRWSFRPARSNGRAVEAYAYLVFGFRRPVTIPPPVIR